MEGFFDNKEVTFAMELLLDVRGRIKGVNCIDEADGVR